jgi:hypothetical protein
MAGAKLEKTRWPGIYRRGDRWAYEWTDTAGKRRRGSADTREQASTLKGQREADAARGEFGEAGLRSRLTLAAYALDLYGATLDSSGSKIQSYPVAAIRAARALSVTRRSRTTGGTSNGRGCPCSATGRLRRSPRRTSPG